MSASNWRKSNAMKILWLVNVALPELDIHLGRTPGVFEGWLIGALHAVRESGNELVICTSEQSCRFEGKYEVNGTTYYIVGNASDEDRLRGSFRRILDDEKPDVVHLYGTEFVQCWAMAQEANPDRMVVTIQGALEYYKDVVYGDLPEKVCRDTLLHKLLRKAHKGGQSIELQKRSFYERAEREVKVLKKAKYINGGSGWGDAVAKAINPKCTTVNARLILRDSFYTDDRWSCERCEPHTIYTLMSYPIKGFHKVLEALPIILERFPDTKVYAVATPNGFRNCGGIKRWIMDHAPDYQWYIQKQIESKGLSESIRYLGYLKEEEVKEYLLRSNVFVSASIIENQSTALGEAMILGVPSVASCVGAMLEMIDHGKDGFLYPFHEPYLLADVVCRIFADQDLAKQFSEKGHAHAARTYDRKENCEDLIRIYRKIDEEAGGRKQLRHSEDTT